ncbi:MAG: tetratricopeptide repeat protein [Bacteroidales bacterium]|jgi:tetratricopeptide (TPR) repeat protein
MKYLLVVFVSLCISCSIVSCGGKGTKSNVKKTIVSDSISPEITALNAKIQKDPNNPELFNQRAELLAQKNKLDEALADIRTALNIDSSKAPYYLTLSDVYFAQGKARNCKQAIEKALTLDPKSVNADLKYAELKLYFKEYNTTFEYINKALEIDKINAKAYFMKGVAYKLTGDTIKAVSCFRTTIDQDPNYYHAYMELGLLFSMKNNRLAVDYFEKALKLNPKSIEARYGLGMFYQGNGEIDNAIMEYDSILRIDPKFKMAHFNLGYIHIVYMKEYSKALKHFTDAIECDPKYAEAYYNRGYTYELMGDIQNAKKDYNKALEIRTNYQKAIDGLNRIDRHAGAK